MKDGKTSIQIVAHTNLDEVMKKLRQIEEKLAEASSMIEELASEGVSVEFEIES